jgi:hypothetical protein
MKKLMTLIGILIICISLVVSGCTKTDSTNETNQLRENEQTTNLPEEEQQPANISEEDPPQPSIPGEKEQFEVTESDKISGWNELKARVYLFKLEINSEGMSWSPLPDYKMTTFSLHFPDNWMFNGSSVFNNQDTKVAEIVPVAEANITIDDLFKNYQPSVISGEELISKELFEVNGYQGLRIISKNQVPWYPHKYYISNGSNIFSMFFYSFGINESEQQLFEKVISTFKFRDETFSN